MSVNEQPPTTEWQQTKMRVGAEILKDLSKGIYSNPASARVVCSIQIRGGRRPLVI